MHYRRLGRTELRVSGIGLGCVTFGREIDEPASFAVMDRAFEAGITLFDTAEVYAAGRSEEIVGRWLASRGAREQVVVATKVAGSLTRERVLASAEASLRRLQLDTIDLFQLHRWDGEVPLDETLAALDELASSGKVRALGVSNWAAWQVCKALWHQDSAGRTRIDAVQQPYNLVLREIEGEMLPLCDDQQVGVLAYSAAGAGFLTGKYRRDAPIPPNSRFEVVPGHHEPYFTDAGFRIMEGLRTLAGVLAVPMAQLALGWAFSRPNVASVLVGARSPEHIDQALEAQALPLPLELLDALDRL